MARPIRPDKRRRARDAAALTVRTALSMPLRAVSFDAAGTLFHPARPIGELYAGVASRHGLTVDGATVYTRLRRALAAAPPLAFPGAPVGELRTHERTWWRTVVARVFAEMSFPDFDACFDDLFALFATADAWRVDRDARPLLEGLRAHGLTILVVSNFDGRVHDVMTAIGLAPYVDQVTISSEAGAAKPDPRIFEVALARAGLDATEVVHVGDSVGEDLAGGRAAGIRVLLVGDQTLGEQAPDATVLPRLADVRHRLDR